MAKVLLLVEGDQDFHVVKHLAAAWNLGNVELVKSGQKPRSDIAVKVKSGFEQLRDGLPVDLRDTEIKVYGIIVDANSNPSGRWQSIRDKLSATRGLDGPLFKDLPEGPELEGTLIDTTAGGVVGLWIWPNNSLDGDLERFASFLVPGEDLLLSYAETVIANLPTNLFQPSQRHKALIHSWLAWQESPGEPLGRAIQNKCLDAKSPAGESFAKWLTKLRIKAESIYEE